MGKGLQKPARRGPPWALLASGVVAVTALMGWLAWQAGRPAVELKPAVQLTLHQAPGCGCCGEYVAYLRETGYAVRVVLEQDMQAVKERYRVPRALWSCHTVAVGRYFVEGHVPVEAVEELLRRSPDLLGIALPGMPGGSPGMAGPREGPLVVYAVSPEGRWREFARF
ncbi:MAG: DUF411 domain-containing protein [Armatimonadota bacterium]|nr:DUF411 domain-containing protein [Armatimonadota bacterium]MDR7440098.1 DUF411 domain-containing protein [Armatimonadota bacterium]MDR7563586.1 DUF411 domain-containing protein [Armatimonadota bacterium]MDR7567804.1 DUF411 domain-containing protein [Armatimonadota bacterium]MDR7602198.1 DUF411 domain-containing protein [Armatimonadota bacterium]